MSAKLEKEASYQASQRYAVWRQMFVRVPPIPAGVDLAGKTVLVTGSNIGLGLECARQFLKLGASLLIMAVRSLERGHTAASGLRSEFPSAKIEVWPLDLTSFRSVEAFAARCESELDHLHVAVLNAGMGKEKFERVKEGKRREMTIQVNYLATALLALLLLPKMKTSASTLESPPATTSPSRLTIISSDASLNVKLEDPGNSGILDSIDRPESFVAYPQYSITKLLITMFTAKLAETVDPQEVIVNCANPAATKGTGFLRDVESVMVKLMFRLLFQIIGRELVDAARIYVHSSLVLDKESHGAFTDWLIRPWPLMMYTDLGRKLGDKLWEETLEELRFATASEALKNIKQ
ncbi:hypothetical protein JX265_010639 [Neoarthrinium moseri]|uniref:Uncharacterized protein n=1 Tax=Neoarthrinium moseri TaxID=1658444 RepID=A0A9P9WEA9_9PEZI|nr:hypothetical protein JX265_010639 [Neoarthrinium moseri]